jgi:hypothetical protein
VDPVFQVGQLAEFWHFEIFCEVDFIRIVIEWCVKSSGYDFAVVSQSDDLGLEEVLFSGSEGR